MILSVIEKFCLVRVTGSANLTFVFKTYGNVWHKNLKKNVFKKTKIPLRGRKMSYNCIFSRNVAQYSVAVDVRRHVRD